MTPEVESAIRLAAGSFGYYAGKGSISYGEHMPWIMHGANVGCSAAVVAFVGQAASRFNGAVPVRARKCIVI